MNFILGLISLYPKILLGFLIINLVWKTVETRYFLVKVFLTYIIGFGASSLISFIWIWIGFSVVLYVYVEIFFAIAFSLYLIAKYFKNLNINTLYTFIKGIKEKALLFLVFGCITIFIVILIIKGLETPHGGFDAWYNWNVVSRFIYRGGNEWQATFSRETALPDYPLFLPISTALTWIYIQKESVFGPIAFHLNLSLFTVGLLFAFLNIFKGTKQATLAVIFFIAQPLSTSGMGQLADFPLSYIILAIGGIILLYFKIQEKQLAVLAGFMSGLAPWIKNEGIVIAISTTAVWFFIQWFYKHSVLKNYFLGFILPISVVILFKTFLAPASEILSNGENLFENLRNMERYILILQKYIGTFLNINGGIGVIGCLILYMLVIGKTHEKMYGLWVLGLTIFFQLLAYFMVFLITPYDLKWHLTTSLDRLFLHVYPLFLLLIFTWLKSPDELIVKEEINYAPRH